MLGSLVETNHTPENLEDLNVCKVQHQPRCKIVLFKITNCADHFFKRFSQSIKSLWVLFKKGNPTYQLNKLKRVKPVYLNAFDDISMLLGHLNSTLSNFRREGITPELNSSLHQTSFEPRSLLKFIFGDDLPNQPKMYQRKIN